MFHYHPEGIYVCDSWYFHHEGLTHCIHLQQQLRPGSTRDERERGALGHAVSEDLIEWKTLPTAVYPGEPGSYDDMEIWTGCTVHHDGRWHTFYTARSSGDTGTVNRIALAVSEDGIVWEKHPANPLFIPDPKWYYSETNPAQLAIHCWPFVDCRDLCVVPDREGNGYWGFVVMRQYAAECAETSVIGLCHSYDLVNWTQHPPCFAPNKYACIEVPEVFYLNGKWYLLYLTGNVYGQRNCVSDPNLNVATVYAVADSIEGPYCEPEDNVLFGSIESQGFCAKTVEVDNERYLFYTQGELASGSSFGTVSLPKVLRTDEEGRLFACYSPRIEKYQGNRLFEGSTVIAIENDGAWGSIGSWENRDGIWSGSCRTDWTLQVFDHIGNHFNYSVEMTIEDARSAGLVFRVQGNNAFGGAYVVLLDADAQEVLFTKTRHFPRIEARKWKIERGKTYHVRVLAIDSIINVFIDNGLVLQLYHQEFASGKFGLFVEQGKAFFHSIEAVSIS